MYILSKEFLKANFRLMDRCSNSGVSSQKRERVRRERVSRKKLKVHEKRDTFSNDLWLQRVEK